MPDTNPHRDSKRATVNKRFGGTVALNDAIV